MLGLRSQSSAACVTGRAASQLDEGVLRNQGAGFVRALTADANLSGQNHGLRLLPRFNEAALDQQQVQSLLLGFGDSSHGSSCI